MGGKNCCSPERGVIRYLPFHAKRIEQFSLFALRYEACLSNCWMSFGLAESFLPIFFRQKAKPDVVGK